MSDDPNKLSLEEKIDMMLFAIVGLASCVRPNSKESAEVLAGFTSVLPAPSFETLKKAAVVARKTHFETGAQVMAEVAEKSGVQVS